VSLSLIIPAFNERDGIEKCLYETYVALSEIVNDFEIIVIDDASRDGTYDLACRFKESGNYSKIQVFQNSENLGQGGSLKKGFDLAQKELLAHNSVDMPFHNRDWKALITQAKDADMVIVERVDRGNYGAYRKLISYTFVSMLNIIFSQKMTDYSFIQVFKKEIYHKCVQPRIRGTALFMPSLIVTALKRNLNVKRIKAEFQKRGCGAETGASLKNIILGIYELVILRFGVRF
jgi:glycosyltransferase involved in cell wall biosynthesis